MSPVNQLSVLAFAAGALAVPQHGHGHGHGHTNHRFHWGHPSSSSSASGTGTGAPFPFPIANATGLYGTTGTGFAPGTSAALAATSASSYSGPVVTVSPLPVVETTVESVVEAASTSDCTTDVTVTTTELTYVTVTPSSSVEAAEDATTSSRSTSTVTVQSTVTYTPSSSASAAPSYSAGNSSSVAAYTASSSVKPVIPFSSWAAYTASSAAPSTSSAEASASTFSAVGKHRSWHPVSSAASSSSSSSSVYVAPTTSSSSSESSSSVYVAPATTSSAYSTSAYSTSSTTSSAAATSSASSSSGGKRGLAYNDASLTSCFMDSPHVGWAYNWGSSASGFNTTSSINYVPLLWGTSSDFTDGWSDNAAAAIKAGSEYLFSFNEPDLSTQANLSPEDAASAYMQYMQPFAGQAKLCAPAVTNGGGAMGLTWLSNFMAACTDCTIDCVSIHWYDSYSNGDYFKDQVTNATSVSGGKPVFVSEFGSTDGSDDDISGFLEDVMPWMDSNDDVAGYAYFMVSDGLLVSSGEPSGYGSTYANYS